jgi:uncharacterized membrane protein YadS
MTAQLAASHAGMTDGRAPSPASRLLSSVRILAPGLAVTAVATTAVLILGQFVHTVSPLLIAIVVGAIAANVTALPSVLRPGLTFASKKLLRIGVALLGLQLVLGDILGLGAGMVAVVVAIVTLGIVGTMFVGQLLGLSWTQRLLIACGFSICGAAAVLAVDGVVDAEEEEVVTAVALVVIFGTCMIPFLPLMASAMGLGEVSIRQRRMTDQAANIKRPPLVPLFVVAFLACAALRTTGILPSGILAGAKLTQTAFLAAAMFALGTGVNIAALRKVGMRPFVLAAISTVWVAGIALTGVLLAG